MKVGNESTQIKKNKVTEKICMDHLEEDEMIMEKKQAGNHSQEKTKGQFDKMVTKENKLQGRLK